MASTLPNNEDAEKFILSGILLNNELITECLGELHPDDFFVPANKILYKGMELLSERNEEITYITLVDVLKAEALLEKIGTVREVVEYITSIQNSAPLPTNLTYYVGSLKEKAIEREKIRTIARFESAIRSGDKDAADECEQRLYDLNNKGSSTNAEHTSKFSDHVLSSIYKKGLAASPITGLATGFLKFDILTSGLHPDNLVILAARPGFGKTAFVMNIAQFSAIKRSKTVLVFSVEMSKSQLYMRMLAGEARVPMQKIKTGMLDSKEWARLIHARDVLDGAKIIIDDTPSLTPLTMRAVIKRTLMKEGSIDLVIVDYLQLMNWGHRVENRQQEVTKIAQELKVLAKTFHLPLIALSQLSRAPETRNFNNHRPNISDLRESGCLTGDTEIYLPDSGEYIPIVDLMSRTNFNVASFNEETSQYEKAVCTNVFSTGRKKVFQLETFNGKIIKLTENHKLLGENGWAPLRDFKIHDKIHIPKNLSFDTGKKYNLDELAFTALMIGDGSMLKRASPKFVNKDLDVIDEIQRLATNIFKDKLRIRAFPYKSWVEVSFSSNEIKTHFKHSSVTDFFRGLDLFDKRSYEKRIPKKFFELGNLEQAHFLRYLWTTDGGIYIKPRLSRGKGVKKPAPIKPRVSIYYSTTSRGLAEDIIKMLSRLNITAKITKTTKDNYRPNYNIDIIGKPSQYLFCTSIGIYGKRKSLLVTRALQSLSSVEEEYRFDSIRSITELGEEEVYDLTVDKNHNFVANNILVHNSIEQAADIVGFLYREEMYGRTPENRGLAELIIAKHREGATETIHLGFTETYTKFENLFIKSY